MKCAESLKLLSGTRLLSFHPCFDFNLIESTLKKLKLPTKVPTKITNKNLIKHMSFDKKKKGGKNRFVLLERIGFCVINTTIKEKYLEEMLKVFRG